MKPGDIVIIYGSRHYGRSHRIVEIHGNQVCAVQLDTKELVIALACDCEVVS